MTVSSTTVKNSYSGNGSTTQFAYGYKIFADSDLIVIIRVNSTGAETVKSLGTHYNVAGAGDASGGSITFTSGNVPASGETVVIIREVPQTQAIDYIANDPFPAESHEEGLDRATMTTQQVQEELDRSLKISRTNTMTSTEFTVGATDRANKVLSFDSSGELAVTQELGTFKGNSATTTTAAYVVRDIVKSTTTAQLNNIYICIQASPVGTALTNTSYWTLIVDAVSAATSATAAASSASAASTSATAATNNGAAQVTLATAQVALATTQANNSATSATASASSATASGNSATASANSATAAAASADAFDDIYLGTKSSDPSTDNDGDALAAGMLYFNSTNDILRVYSGSAWQDAALSSTGVVTLTGTQTLTNKTLTDAVAITNSITGEIIPGKIEGTNFTDSLLVGHSTTGTLSSAERNTAVGIDSMPVQTTGDDNVALGFNTLNRSTGGIANTAIGSNALKYNVGGQQNVAVGMNALDNANNSYNVAVGVRALTDATEGYNTALGNRSGSLISSGEYNTTLGHKSGDNITSGSGNVVIGDVDVASATGDRQLVIAGYDGSTTTTWIDGSSSGVVTLNAANVTQQALTSSSNAVAWDASAKPNAVHVTTENTTFSAPSNNVEGAFIALEINYNGSHTIAFNTVFEFAASTAPTFTSADGKTDILVFRYNGAVWQEVGRTLNLSES
uniref:Tail fiber protein n=1 Tax=uncultured marine virus TaxID=186617 RepID=A0A0F7LAC8_9VIRU|nr:hypothetical protein [uncultured marine virus]